MLLCCYVYADCRKIQRRDNDWQFRKFAGSTASLYNYLLYPASSVTLVSEAWVLQTWPIIMKLTDDMRWLIVSNYWIEAGKIHFAGKLCRCNSGHGDFHLGRKSMKSREMVHKSQALEANSNPIIDVNIHIVLDAGCAGIFGLGFPINR